jgi:hypothetical protein
MNHFVSFIEAVVERVLREKDDYEDEETFVFVFFNNNEVVDSMLDTVDVITDADLW